MCVDGLYPHFGTSVLRGLCSSQLLYQHGAQVLVREEEEEKNNSQSAVKLRISAAAVYFLTVWRHMMNKISW